MMESRLDKSRSRRSYWTAVVIASLALLPCSTVTAQSAQSAEEEEALRVLCGAFETIHATRHAGTIDTPPGSQFADLLAGVPATFTLGEQDAWSLLSKWNRTDAPAEMKENRTINETTWAQPDTGLSATLRCVVFHDPPALETRWTFRNQGSKPSDLITRVDSVAVRMPSKEKRTALWSGSGGTSMHFGSSQAGFQMDRTLLGEQPVVKLEVQGGRSSAGKLPIFYLEQLDARKGFAIAIGWSGNWMAEARFVPDNDTVEINAGVQPVHFRLPPGQQVHLPAVLTAPFDGDLHAGVNTLRALLRNHYQGRLGGEPVLPPVSFSTWFVFFNGIHDQMLRELASEAAPLGIEYFCIDAGWFTGHFPGDVGSWVVNEERFPDGLEPVADHVHELGMKLGLWFEPERVAQNTIWHKEHPELMLGHDLLDLSKPETRRLILDMMSGYINRLGVNWIRYDFNTNPFNAWISAEGEEEKGLKQIRYINGLYTMLDELMARHPNLLIEQCSSGGLRIDLETIRHGHTFWKSDDTYNQPLMRYHETGGNHFLLAGHLNTNYCHLVSQGEIIGLFAGPLGFGADFRKLENDQKATIRQCITAYKQVRHYLNQDYYPLFPQELTSQTWDGWQFLDRAKQEGCVILYRPDVSPYPTATIKLRGLEPDRTYHFEELFTGEIYRVPGSRMTAGVRRELEPDVGQVWRYSAR